MPEGRWSASRAAVKRWWASARPADRAELQLFVTSGGRFVRSEALAMIALFVVFLYMQFTGTTLSLP